MKTPSLGEARFPSRLSHTISDDVRIPERIEVGAEPGLQFELAGPRGKLFFDAKQTRAGIVTCGGLCPGLNKRFIHVPIELLATHTKRLDPASGWWRSVLATTGQPARFGPKGGK